MAAEPRTHEDYDVTRIAVIIGAGVGCAVAEDFARYGWHLALLSRNQDRLSTQPKA